MNALKTSLLLSLLLSLQACTNDELRHSLDATLERLADRAAPTGSKEFFLLPDEHDFAAIPQDPANPLNPAKVELGKLLFYETGLGLVPQHPEARNTYSCASCHIPDAGFMPGRAQGIADGGTGFGYNGEGRSKLVFYHDNEPDVQGARALSVCNVAFVTNTAWAGKFGGTHINIGTEAQWKEDAQINHEGLLGPESQTIAVQSVHRMVINESVADSLGYKAHFDAAFPQVPAGQRYSARTLAFALAAYLRTLIPSRAPFQDWLRGDASALSDAEKRGAVLFFSKAGCYKCHNGKAFQNASHFYAVGAKDLFETGQAIRTDVHDERNLGRGGFTNRAEDMYKFKVPQLYNLSGGSHFFHGSSKRSLREVVAYFNEGIPENPRVPAQQLAGQFHPLNLTPEEVDDLVLFLERSLFDREMSRFVPTALPSGNCFPNNDIQSRQDLGCQ